MLHNQESPVEPIKSSTSEFAVIHQNHFVVLNDVKHIIGIHPQLLTKMILENLENGAIVEVEAKKFCTDEITSFFYDEDTRSLYIGDSYGDLQKYKINTTSKTCEEVRNYFNIGIGEISSSYRFMHFVFFGGNKGKIKVLDLSTDKLLPGHLQTSIGYITSLQVYLKNLEEIYLAVSGCKPDYSNDKTDLFNMANLFQNDLLTFKKIYLEYSKKYDEIILSHRSTIDSQEEKIKNLTQQRDSYKEKLDQIQSNYNDLKEKHDSLYNQIQSKLDDLKERHDSLLKQNTELYKVYKTIKFESETKNQEFQKKISILDDQKIKKQTTIISKKESLIGKRSFDEIDPLVNIQKMREDIQQEKDLKKHYQNTIYDVIGHRIAAEKESRELRIELETVKSQLTTIREVVGNK